MQRHIPVLANEIYSYFTHNIKVYFDGTLGHGGHVEFILSRLSSENPEVYDKIKVIGVDKDAAILDKAQSLLNIYKNKISFFHGSYADLEKILDNEKVDFFLLDLGVNLEHFKDAQRGFSIKKDGDLDMRFDTSKDFTAKTIINKYSLEKLVEIFNIYGDFSLKFAEKIVQNIIKQRSIKTIHTTFELAEIFRKIGLNDQKIAVLFQCLRIETNSELEELKNFLSRFAGHINSGGLCCIITYHSIEDRLVKYAFKDLTETKKLKLVNKHVIKPAYKEILSNKASRSAKLRIIQYL